MRKHECEIFHIQQKPLRRMRAPVCQVTLTHDVIWDGATKYRELITVRDGEFHPYPNQPISSATKSEPSDKPPQLIKSPFKIYASSVKLEVHGSSFKTFGLVFRHCAQ